MLAGNNAKRIVPAAVVHTDDPPGTSGCCLQLWHNDLEEGWQHFLFVVTRDHQTKGRIGRMRLGHCRSYMVARVTELAHAERRPGKRISHRPTPQRRSALRSPLEAVHMQS